MFYIRHFYQFLNMTMTILNAMMTSGISTMSVLILSPPFFVNVLLQQKVLFEFFDALLVYDHPSERD